MVGLVQSYKHPGLAMNALWFREGWARRDLNPRPIDYESTALTPELRAHGAVYLYQRYKV